MMESERQFQRRFDMVLGLRRRANIAYRPIPGDIKRQVDSETSGRGAMFGDDKFLKVINDSVVMFTKRKQEGGERLSAESTELLTTHLVGNMVFPQGMGERVERILKSATETPDRVENLINFSFRWDHFRVV